MEERAVPPDEIGESPTGRRIKEIVREGENRIVLKDRRVRKSG